MPRFKAIPFLVLLALFMPLVSRAAPSKAQPGAVDLTAQRLPITPLSSSWRFHPGDNPAYAQPTFNDTGWPQLNVSEDWTAQGYTEQNNLAWLRIRLLVPAQTTSLVLLLPRAYKNFELFANGSRMAQVGLLPPARPEPLISGPHVYTIAVSPSGAVQTLTLALRMWQRSGFENLMPSIFRGTPYIGDPSVVLDQFRLTKAASVLGAGGDYTEGIVGVIVGAAALVLFWLDRQQRFYLWLALYALFEPADMVIRFASEHFTWPWSVTVNLYLVFDLLSTVTIIYMVVDLLRLRYSKAFLPTVFVFLAQGGLLLVTVAHLPEVYGDGIFFTFEFAAQLLILTFLVRGWKAGNVDAGLLFLPLVLAAIPATFSNLGYFLLALHVPHAELLLFADSDLLRQPFEFNLAQATDVLSMLGMLAVLIHHFARTSKDRQRLASALQAAHEVQYQLVPSSLPSTGGFSTEVAYMAAEEVGGDFCQVLPRPDGSLLLALGDVSGKGLRAAMLGTLCVGALGSLAGEDVGPAAALDRLNNVVLRTGYAGFITCLCALVSPAGAITFANAGHLSPYLNGAELALDAGLPLGIIAGAEYTETSLDLPEAARVTLLSDGVVEARSLTGELFGFDRTSSISNSKASQIAADAQQYGPQQDDITVLTLDWKAPVLSPAPA